MSDPASAQSSRPAPPAPDMAEKGAGQQRSDQRLFFQLLAFTGCTDPQPICEQLAAASGVGGLPCVLYADLHDPRGLGLLTFASDPADFVEYTRALIRHTDLASLEPAPALTMLGRTYSIGYEPDLADTLVARPRRYALDPKNRWAVWYPLRRKGGFYRLPAEEQSAILKEHGTLGFAYGRAGLAQDIRLACHGLDRNDNDFVLGLLGEQLTPLSKLVQTMRSTVQTSQWLEKLGPFFVGQVLYQSPLT